MAIAASTYDLYEWENVFPGFSLDGLRQMSHFYKPYFKFLWG